MTNQPQSPPPPRGPVSQRTQQAADGTRRAREEASQVNESIAALRTEADRARGLFGFGRRILVPSDEIHVVVGDGRHTWTVSNTRKVFGQSADRPARYWLNGLTQVIKLKTISFTVPIRGEQGEGVEALDSSKVSFHLWAHAVAKLNPDKAEIAAQRVGLDTTGLIYTITKVGTAELVAAAATMTLEDIIANRQALAEIAFPKVNQILSELGYDLALLTITQLDGMAYSKLIEQAEARISKETSIATNREQIAEMRDDQDRQRTEAEIGAATTKKLAAERLSAQREVETAELDQQEALNVRRHELQLIQFERERTAASTAHATDLTKVELSQALGEAEAEKQARLARLQAERDAELKQLQQERTAAIRLAETEAEAKRLAAQQAREIERAAERTEAEAKRLRAEELAAAERLKEIALTEASAEAQALKTRVEAETQADLVRAEAEADATARRAEAAKIRAEATRAEAAAPGLAEAEVSKARVEVAERQVEVTRAEGLAQAEVARAQAQAEAERLQALKEVEINAQKQLAALYEQSPVLIELEKIRMEHAHKERLTQMQMEANLRAFEAIAPGVRVNVFGGGGQASQLFTDLLGVAQGVRLLGEEVPAVSQWLNGVANNGSSGHPGVLHQLGVLMPSIRQVLAEVNPRVFSTLKVADVLDRLGPVVAGEQDLVGAVAQLKNDANFRVVGDLPVGALLGLMGIDLTGGQNGGDRVVDAAPVTDGKAA